MGLMVAAGIWLGVLIVCVSLFELRNALVMYSLEPIRLRRTPVVLEEDFAHDLARINPCMIPDPSPEMYAHIAETVMRLAKSRRVRGARECERVLHYVLGEASCEVSRLRVRESARVLWTRVHGGAS